MTDLEFGEALPDLTPAQLQFEGSRALLAACLRHPDVVVRALRAVHCPDRVVADGIEIEIDNRQVPARNPHGIRPRERLLLLHRENADLPYEVRTLRKDFPVLLHQNSVPEGEPLSLCLYEQPWQSIARSWTPERFLERIFWWLGRSARGELHAPDQALEQLFYDGGIRVILPVDFEETWVAARAPMHLAPAEKDNLRTLRPIREVSNHDEAIISLIVTIGAVGHPPLTRHPATLGQLAEYFRDLGADLLGPLGSAIGAYWPEGAGLAAKPKQRTLLILRVPRDIGASETQIDTSAVLLAIDPGSLGLMLGVLDAAPGTGTLFRSYETALSGNAPSRTDGWQNTVLGVVQVLFALSHNQARRFSGLTDTTSEFKGILGGAGALGSVLFNLWARAGWGQWTVVDDDIVAPHNLARHLATDLDIGVSKVTVCADAARAIYPAESRTTTVKARIEDPDHAQLQMAIADADLVVDATASLGAGRDLACGNHAARTASVFLSPSGRSSILLLEDRHRQIRLLALEAQYYRAVLNASWGEAHLAVMGAIRPGTTCRDVSFVLPLESVQLHAAILSAQLRESMQSDEARIGVWIQQDDGRVEHVSVDVFEEHKYQAADWTIAWDSALHERLQAVRHQHLPNETGGILLGIIDTSLKRIQVVDVVCAPRDSVGNASGFICGVQGLAEVEAEARRRTHEAVGYVGHWHSHPSGHSAQPSLTDLEQVTALADRLNADGIPGLICIVGEKADDLTWTLGRSVGPADSEIVGVAKHSS